MLWGPAKLQEQAVALVWQLMSIISLVGYVVLVVAAMVYLRRQSLSERDLLVVFVPLGAIVAFVYFQGHNKHEH